MIDETKTLGALLSDPRIAPIAPYAIAHRDLSREEMWHQTLAELRAAHFGGGMIRGFERLFAAAERGNWFFPLYDEAACAEDPAKREVSLVWLPAEDPAAADRPWILLVPGGGFVNVWNLTEGWPVAAQFNDLGYHVAILTYRVGGSAWVLDSEMADFAQAVRFVRDHAGEFGLRRREYITCGFSAGGYLVCLWNVPEKGHAAFGLPGPTAVFPVYPITSWKLCLEEAENDPEGETEEDREGDRRLFGCSLQEAAESPYEIPDHAAAFPPCALFLAAGDTLVNPEHSRRLARALERHGIPCRLEIGPEGGHGFADGEGMCMAGWTARAIRWAEGPGHGAASQDAR